MNLPSLPFPTSLGTSLHMLAISSNSCRAKPYLPTLLFFSNMLQKQNFVVIFVHVSVRNLKWFSPQTKPILKKSEILWPQVLNAKNQIQSKHGNRLQKVATHQISSFTWFYVMCVLLL